MWIVELYRLPGREKKRDKEEVGGYKKGCAIARSLTISLATFARIFGAFYGAAKDYRAEPSDDETKMSSQSRLLAPSRQDPRLRSRDWPKVSHAICVSRVMGREKITFGCTKMNIT